MKIITAASQKNTLNFFGGITAAFVFTWVYFFLHAVDLKDWWIENILVVIFAGLFIFTNLKEKLSNISLVCLFFFLMLHLYGAQMAYTKNDLGALLQRSFHLWRNPYDRIVHFSFGFFVVVPFVDLLSRSLKNRTQAVIAANMAILCLASVFELVEWGVAACTDKITGETYVATQGDVWDAQKDIFVAVIGALITSILLTKTRLRNIFCRKLIYT